MTPEEIADRIAGLVREEIVRSLRIAEPEEEPPPRMQAVIVRNPEVFNSPAFVELFARAFADPKHPDAELARAWACEFSASEFVAVIVAFEAGAFHGLAVVERPSSGASGAFVGAPWLSHVWAETPLARAAMQPVVIDWLAKHGHDRFRVLNRTGHPEEVYQRWLSRWFDLEHVGMVYECRVRPGEVDHERRRLGNEVIQPHQGLDSGRLPDAAPAVRRSPWGNLGRTWRRVSGRSRRPAER